VFQRQKVSQQPQNASSADKWNAKATDTLVFNVEDHIEDEIEVKLLRI
jgi:hypothetical protein